MYIVKVLYESSEHIDSMILWEGDNAYTLPYNICHCLLTNHLTIHSNFVQNRFIFSTELFHAQPWPVQNINISISARMIECEEKEKSQCLSIYICKVHKNWHLTRFGDVINIKVQLTYSCFSAHCPKISAMSGPKFRKFQVCHCVSFSLHFTVLLQNYEQE